MENCFILCRVMSEQNIIDLWYEDVFSSQTTISHDSGTTCVKKKKIECGAMKVLNHFSIP